MEQSVLISVIVPVYNADKFLNRCIDSILNQSYCNFELILVNDGSTDQSGVICDKYLQQDDRVRVIHKVNGGVSSARNAGMREAKGQFVLFVDSDDWLEAEYIEQIIPLGSEDFVYGGYKQYDHGVFVESHTPQERIMTLNEVKEHFFTLLRQQYSFYYVWCCCYNTSILKEKGICFNTDKKIGEDMLFNIQYLENCKTIRFVSIHSYCHDGVDNSLVRRYYPDRADKEKYETKSQEAFAGYDSFYMRWLNWHTAIFHYHVWIKRKTGAERRLVQKQLDKCFSDSYFRACLSYVRKNGTLDERIKTFFMRRWLYPLYDPFYSIIAALSRIKNAVLKRQ